MNETDLEGIYLPRIESEVLIRFRGKKKMLWFYWYLLVLPGLDAAFEGVYLTMACVVEANQKN